MPYQRDCNHCGITYTTKSKKSKFCSGDCRLKNHRAGSTQDQYNKLFVEHLHKLRGMSDMRLIAIHNHACRNRDNGIGVETANFAIAVIEFVFAERGLGVSGFGNSEVHESEGM